MKSLKKTVDELIPLDDVFWQKLAESPRFCEEILQTILQLPDLRIIQSEPQKSLRNIKARSVILDALCTSSNGKYFNIEVQKANDDDHQRRVRYNSANMDTYISEKGTNFSDLPDTYVIYISRFDIFKAKRCLYHVDRILRETGNKLDNGFHEIYVNCTVNDGSNVAKLMELFTKPYAKKNTKYPEFYNRVRYFKEGKGREDMCETVEKYAQEVARETAKKTARETAQKMFIQGISFEIVRNCISDLSDEELHKIETHLDV